MKRFYGGKIALFAVLMAVQATPAPTYDPMVAFVCNKGTMYMDPDNGWVTDSSTDCMHETFEILSYCKKIYPTLNVTNVVETSEPMVVKGWCPLRLSSCSTPDTVEVQPYRCLSGTFQSDSLIQPDGCKFSYLSEVDKCDSHSIWRRLAREACGKGDLTQLSNYAMLEPCGLDKWSGVEYVCCPKAEVAADAVIPSRSAMDPKIARYLQMMPRAGEYRNEHGLFKLAKKELKQENHDRLTEVLKVWAEKRKARLQSRPAEDNDDGVSDKYEKDFLMEQERAEKSVEHLDSIHQQHVQVNFNSKKRVAMQKLMEELKTDRPSEANIALLLKHYIQLEEEDGVTCVKHFVKMRSRDPEQAEGMLPVTIEHLHLISLRINQSIDLLETLTDKQMVERVKEDVWAYVRESPLKADMTVRRLTSYLSKRQTTVAPLPAADHVTSKRADAPPARLFFPESGDRGGGEEQQISYQSLQDASSKGNSPVATTPTSTNVPAESGSDSTILKRRLSAVPSIALAAGVIAAMMVVVSVILMVKTRSRRKRKGHMYLEVTDGSADLSPEDRHIAAMQHGFENPTYALLEQRKL